jgi:hypothetical protein
MAKVPARNISLPPGYIKAQVRRGSRATTSIPQHLRGPFDQLQAFQYSYFAMLNEIGLLLVKLRDVEEVLTSHRESRTRSAAGTPLHIQSSACSPIPGATKSSV